MALTSKDQSMTEEEARRSGAVIKARTGLRPTLTEDDARKSGAIIAGGTLTSNIGADQERSPKPEAPGAFFTPTQQDGVAATAKTTEKKEEILPSSPENAQPSVAEIVKQKATYVLGFLVGKPQERTAVETQPDNKPSLIDQAEKFIAAKSKSVTEQVSAIRNQVNHIAHGVGDKLEVHLLGIKQMFSHPVANAIISASQQHDCDPMVMATIAHVESKGKPTAFNKDSKGCGLYQFVPVTAKEYGLNDPTSIAASCHAAACLLKNNTRIVEKLVGRKISDAEKYLAHQQGAGGAAALLNHGGENAVAVLERVYLRGGTSDKARALAHSKAVKAVIQNGGHTEWTAEKFADHVMGMYNKSYAEITHAGKDVLARNGAMRENAREREAAPEMASVVERPLPTPLNKLQGTSNKSGMLDV